MKPRILLLANNIDEVGGAQRVVHVLAQGLGERGYPVSLIGVVPHASGFPHEQLLPVDVVPAYRTERLASRRLPVAPRASRARRRIDPTVRKALRARAAAEAAVVRRLQGILDAGPPGIAITAQLWAMEFLAKCDLGDPASADRWRVIGQYHSSYEAASRGRDLDRARIVYRDVDLFLALTEADADRLTEAGFANASWLENPLAFWPADPLDPPAADSVEDGSTPRSPRRTTHRTTQRAVYLGRFSGEKAPLLLLQAWEQARRLGPEAMAGWSLDLIGSGPQEDLVRATAAEQPGVQVHGPTTEPAAVLAGADLVVLPSLDEGFPLVLAEAMASGVACVASDCSPGVRALIRDGQTGLLAERGNRDHLAAQILALAGSASERMRLGRAARASVGRLRIERILDQWEERFAQVMR